ncbi:hypothetical protein CNMCM8980_002708 [Aspergillus fumigatiaffinis]|uniref:Uncharacterized protein n=1 Tax=Aspergillus fumigatiaffinis TaxID=340414 RepID=A0A8H4GS59_9EURO|nr:hypothetical protein CNMCM6805_003103 [Aspergillus fumigatiaffinis]KAF4236889.1 hypothetical protein CNMCM8980_002708 [Aspergillus fumigatiaffinis]
MKPPTVGPTAGPINGAIEYNSIGPWRSFRLNRSLTVPPETARNALPDNPSKNRDIIAQAANIHPIIAVGSQNSEFVVPFLNSGKGDRIVDYTAYKTSKELVIALKDAIKEAGVEDGRAYDAYDCVSENETYVTLSKVSHTLRFSL